MKDIETLSPEEFGALAVGEQFLGTLKKAADFRHFTAIQGISSLDNAGHATFIFVRNEPNLVRQVYTVTDPSILQMQVGQIEVNAHQVQACHVQMDIAQAAQTAAQVLALLLREHPDAAHQALRNSDLKLVSE